MAIFKLVDEHKEAGMKRLNLHRTFTEWLPEKRSDEDHDFSAFLSGGHVAWDELLKKPVIVVLGEAGSGKTWELTDQVKRMRQDRRWAFFVALNKLSSGETLREVLAGERKRFDEWTRGKEGAHFFLDAVDESRLLGPQALSRALGAVMSALEPFARRISLVLTSRVSDWQLQSVRDTVQETVVAGLSNARKGRATQKEKNGSVSDTVVSEVVTLQVFRLAPLSKKDAQRLAQANGAEPVADFWSNVVDGDYDYMVARPRDVEWLAKRWAALRKIGTFSELTDAAVTQRLVEHNDSYIEAGGVLSKEMLREGAERLAAASVFCGRPYIALPGESQSNIDVDPAAALADWGAKEQRRLLGVAVFDEATYGRVKFHHRTSREYLAACWLDGLLSGGLPLSMAMDLFGGVAFGEQVLLNDTRATLCWLAALNVQVREWVVSQFPEMLFFDGDPSAWSEADVEEAFFGYVERLATGYRPDWWNDLGELRRVARCIPAEALRVALRRYPASDRVTVKLLTLIQHGEKYKCADEVFSIYRVPQKRSRFALYALHVLEAIATDEQQRLVKADLLAGTLDNETAAAALQVVKLENLGTEDLISIFSRTTQEQDFGGGPMARWVNRASKNCNAEQAISLVTALMGSLSCELNGSSVRLDDAAPKDRWKLRMLGACLARAIHRLPGKGESAPVLLLEAALLADRIENTSHGDRKSHVELGDAVAKKPAFRERLMVVVGKAASPQGVVGNLWGSCFRLRDESADLNIALRHASREDDAMTQDIGFRAAYWIAQRRTGEAQDRIVGKLLAVDDSRRLIRQSYIDGARRQAKAAKKSQRNHLAKEEDRERQGEEQNQANRNALLADIDELRAGRHFGAIQFLVNKASERDSEGGYSRVNFATIESDYGKRIGHAFDKGLEKFWTNQIAPDVHDHPDNSVPWSGLLGLASVNHAVLRGLNLARLEDDEVAKAVKFCVWEAGEAPAWFADLARKRTPIVVQTLAPWVEYELGMKDASATWARTTDLVLSAPDEVRKPIVKGAMDYASREWVESDRLRRRLFDVASELGLLTRRDVEHWMRRQLAAADHQIRAEDKRRWLSRWFQLDIGGAWNWVKSHDVILENEGSAVALCVSRAIIRRRERQDPIGSWPTEVETLSAIYRFIAPHASMKFEHSEVEDDHWHPVQQAKKWVAETLSSIDGIEAHTALVALKARAGEDWDADWLQTLVVQHAIASRRASRQIDPAWLAKLGNPFCKPPSSGDELFMQVSARLQQIQRTTLSGPFSDRALMSDGMSEKKLQLWLASRLNDTPQRKFSTRYAVFREPEVDNDKRTDIEVSAQGFKVCVEIKPLNKQRYSAQQLRNTLSHQLAGQYLKGGENSRHGILVLILVEDRTWHVPGVGTKATFAQLLTHLTNAASEILAGLPGIRELAVIGIDARMPVKTRTN